MGADLIIATLWCELGPPQEVVMHGNTYIERNPVLNWQAGHDYIDTLKFPKPSLVEYFDNQGLIPEAKREDQEVEDLTVDVLNDEFRKVLHDQLKQMQDSIEGGWRDVTSRHYGDACLLLSGGMSWGDSPTEASELWWWWDGLEQEDDAFVGVSDVLTKVGFWWLDTPAAPFELVRK